MNFENGNWIDTNCLHTLNYHVCERRAAKPAAPKPGKEGKLLRFLQEQFNIYFIGNPIIAN